MTMSTLSIVISIVVSTLLPSGSSAATDDCPLKGCCEQDCCGPGTLWDIETDYCIAADPSSPGWLPLPNAQEAVCEERVCCEDTCCGQGTRYDDAMQACVSEWTLVAPEAPWSIRAGLQVVELNGDFVLMGGRTSRPPSFPPIIGDSDIWGDVWKSSDAGSSWTELLSTNDETHWSARAYFRAETLGDDVFLFGGQNFKVVPTSCPPVVPNCPPFVSASDFFHDVWKSADGIQWTRLTDNAGWEPRAGLSSVVLDGSIYVMGGSQNDDSAIGGPQDDPTGPPRIYFNDVWSSQDGMTWQQLTASAPWAPRAGAVTVVKDNYIYLFGGEDGFTCAPLPTCEPPYFNDVWRTRDGMDWELVTANAEWPSRAGHQVGIVDNKFYLFGGFGLLANPKDVWASRDGASWVLTSDSPWNAIEPSEIKYDFATQTVGTTIYTFGGDRETFNFTDPLNYLQLDNDVWTFEPSDYP